MTRAWEALLLWLAYDDEIQVVGAITSLCGCWLSIVLSWDAWRHYRAVAANGASLPLRLVAWQGLRTQGGLAVAQLCFVVISLTVLTLPPLPTDGTMPDAVLWVIGTRKLLRLVIILTLCFVAWTSARTRRRVHDLLTGMRAGAQHDA